MHVHETEGTFQFYVKKICPMHPAGTCTERYSVVHSVSLPSPVRGIFAAPSSISFSRSQPKLLRKRDYT
jgi:hypothetical protein